MTPEAAVVMLDIAIEWRYRKTISIIALNTAIFTPGLIRLHILHHAVEGPIFGLEMAEELARHGYRISLGTLYPLLHGLEKKGYLRSARKAQRAIDSQSLSGHAAGKKGSSRR